MKRTLNEDVCFIDWLDVCGSYQVLIKSQRMHGSLVLISNISFPCDKGSARVAVEPFVWVLNRRFSLLLFKGWFVQRLSLSVGAREA